LVRSRNRANLDLAAHTFEIIAYRIKENLGSPRKIDHESVKVMNAKHDARTFNNLDPESGRVLVSPHGLDPVLLGIRGYSPDDVLAASRRYSCAKRLKESRSSGLIKHGRSSWQDEKGSRSEASPIRGHHGRVEDMPRVMRGGHVIFGLKDDSGSIDCAVYRPTGCLAMAARDLLPVIESEHLEGSGMARGKTHSNVEKLDVLHLVEKVEDVNPMCGKCGGRCESMGRGQGLRCKKCGQRYEYASKSKFDTRDSFSQLSTFLRPELVDILTRPDSRPRMISNPSLRVEDFQLRVEITIKDFKTSRSSVRLV